MSDEFTTPVRETLLRQCLAADPGPWYPKDYAEKTGTDRESLYGPLWAAYHHYGDPSARLRAAP